VVGLVKRMTTTSLRNDKVFVRLFAITDTQYQ